MDELRLLLSATGLGDRAEQLKQSILWSVAWGLGAFVVAINAGGLLAWALYSALLLEYGAVNAALLGALIFAAVAVVCGFVAWHCYRRQTEPRHSSRQAERGEVDLMGLLASSGHRDSPMRVDSLWDIATLVAIGVIAGNSSKRRPGQ